MTEYLARRPWLFVALGFATWIVFNLIWPEVLV